MTVEASAQKVSPAWPSSRDLLGPTRPDYQPDADAKARQHVDQCISAEEIDATAQEVANSWLRDPKYFRGLGLFEPSRRNRLLHLNQQGKILVQGTCRRSGHMLFSSSISCR